MPYVQIKGIRGMHFYDVVPVDHLLERMAIDRNCPAVCAVLTDLFLNSFYPQTESTGALHADSIETAQLNRCVQFVEKNRAAAEVFYSHLHKHIAIGHTAKLITMIFTFIITSEARSNRAAAATSTAVGEDGAEEKEGSEVNVTGGKRRRPQKVR